MRHEICQNAVVSSLEETDESLAKEWHSTKNGGLRPTMVSPGSYKKVWWSAACGHEWDATVANRTRGAGCPFCSARGRKRILPGFNDLLSLHPAVASQWHPTRNTEKPSSVAPGSHRKVWWMCSRRHEWKALVYSRVSGVGCPFCAGKRPIPGETDLLSTHTMLASQWSLKNRLPVTEISAGSNKRAWWVCADRHEWEATVDNRVKGKGCPYCSGRKVVPGLTDIVTTHPALAREWHPTKNGVVAAEDVSPGSNKPVWWQCGEGHEWRTAVSNRAGSGNGCAVCSGRVAAAGVNDLLTLRPDLAAEWHPTKNDRGPDSVRPGAGYRAWWLGACGHEWDAQICSRTGSSNPGCPYCSPAPKRVLAGFNDLASQRPEIASQWHPFRNGPLSPEHVSVGTDKAVWWACEDGHEWVAFVYSRTGAQPSGCPTCRPAWSVAEKQVVVFLRGRFPELELVENERTLLGSRRELDIYIPSQNLGIEFNGLYWHDESKPEVRRRHAAKIAAAQALGIALAVVWEDDWKVRRAEVEEALMAIVRGDGIPAWMTFARQPQVER